MYVPLRRKKELRERNKIQIKIAQVVKTALQHTVINLYEYGAFFDDHQFPAKSSRSIIAFLQETYPEKYGEFAAAKSFFYRTIAAAKKAALSPHLNPFRDRRGENKKKPKRENPEIVTLCDEWFSEPKQTAPKIKAGLARRGYNVSLSTIHRIANDLMYRWTKPWYTDVLTPAQKLKRKLFTARLLRMSERTMLTLISNWLFTDEKWWDIVGPSMSEYVKAKSKTEAKLLNQVQFLFVCFYLFPADFFLLCLLFLQVKRHKSKKGGIKKRVYFWGGICWHGKTKGIAWTAADNKVLFRHTKNLCVGTIFEDEDDNGQPCVYRIVQTRAASTDGNVSYVEHFRFPDCIPPERHWHYSSFGEVKEWHAASRAVLATRADLQPPTCMQDTAKTLEIYEDALYPALQHFGIDSLVEDNASPHNNNDIRDSHRRHHVNIVGYHATAAEKDQIVALIRQQTTHYRREQDKKAQLTKQTRELDRLPAWPPNSPDLNLIEIVWSWMVRWIRDEDGGWSGEPELLKVRVLEAWDAVPMDSFRELLRSYRVRLEAIHSVNGDGHPNFT